MVGENTQNKNLMPYVIVISALIVAGAVIFTGVYLKGQEQGLGSGLGEVLEEGAGPAAVVEQEPQEQQEPQYEAAIVEKFVQCLKDKGMKFYGAHWCGWCNKQKEELGQLGQELLYIECVDQETGDMTQACQQAEITSFPTWVLPNGSKNPGYKPLDQLAQLSGCEL